MTTIHGGHPFGDDAVGKAVALAAYVAATSGLAESDWSRLGLSPSEAAKGHAVRGVHFDREPVEPGADVPLMLLTFGGLGQGTHLLHGRVSEGRFAFTGPDFGPPAEGSAPALANARLSDRPVGPADRAEAVNLVAGHGRSAALVADPEQGVARRVFVTTSELGGALDYAMIHKDGRVRTDPHVMAGVRDLAEAVVQPAFGPDMRRTGFARTGRDGMDDLFRGFGAGGVRGLWIDPAAAGRVAPDGAALLDRLVEATASRDPRLTRREAVKAKVAQTDAHGR